MRRAILVKSHFMIDVLRCYLCRTGSREPAGRCVHQRPSITEPYSFEDRRDGSGRYQAVRHIEAAEGVSRMRIQNPEPVSGNRIDQTRSDRRQQTASSHAGSRGEDRGFQAAESGHIQLGNTGEIDKGPLILPMSLYLP